MARTTMSRRVSASTPENWGEHDPAVVAYAKGTPRSALDEVVIFPFNDVEALERIVAPHAHEIAALIVDPFPSAMGLAAPKPGYLSLNSPCLSRDPRQGGLESGPWSCSSSGSANWPRTSAPSDRSRWAARR